MRDALYLPTDQSPGQMMGTWSTALAAAAFDVGMWFAKELNARNPNWVPELEHYRRQFIKHYKVHVADPSWVFREPTYPASPLAMILPHGFKGAFWQVKQRRDDWFHRNVPWNLPELMAAVEELRSATAFVPEARFNEEVPHLSGYLFLLQSKGVLPTEREQDLADLVERSKLALDEAQAQVRAMEKRLVEIQAMPSTSLDVAAALEKELGEARDRAVQAEEDAAQLKETLAKIEQRASQGISPDDLLPIDIRPGDPWPQDLPLGRRRMTLLKAPMPAIYEVSRGAFITDELGEVARAAAARWHEVMPMGGEIWVTPGWHSAGNVNGRTTYLGRMDEPPEQVCDLGAQMQDFLLPINYRLLKGDIEDERAETRLSSVRDLVITKVVVTRISDAVMAAVGQGRFSDEDLAAMSDAGLDFRISLHGHIAATMNEARCYLTTVTADEWFPGVLRG